MKLSNEILLSVDEYFTQTRLRICTNNKCMYYCPECEGCCGAKEIVLNEVGRCVYAVKGDK